MSRHRLFLGACAAMFVFGIVLAILGALFGLPAMRERLGITLVEQGDILLLLFFGVFLSTVIVGPMIDSFGNKSVLTVSAALVTLALIALAFAHSFGSAVSAAIVLGFGGGGLNTSSNALVADLFPENRGAMLNVVGAAYGVGALLIPLLAAVLTGLFTIPQLLAVAAALAGVCTIFYVVLPFPPPREAIGFSLLASVKAIRIPGVLLFGLILFCQSGNESSIGGWTSTYLGSIGANTRIATWILGGYWAGLMAGRVAAAKFLRVMTKRTLVLASAIGSLAGSAVMLWAPSIPVVAFGAILTGFSFAAIYPTTLALAADRYERLAGTIFGLLFAIGLLGGMLFPWIVGHIGQAYSVRAGMIVPLAGAIAICVIATLLESRSRA